MLYRIGSLILSAFLITSLLMVVTTKNAHAYIDAASGGFLLQMLIAVSISSLIAIKIFWHRLINIVSRYFSKLKRFGQDRN